MSTTPRAPSLQGNTLFLGDSLTVDLPPFVGVNGQKSILAEVSKTSDWLLASLRGIEKLGALDGPGRPANVIVLIGTNDVGGSRTTAQIFDDITNVWSIARAHGARVVAMTLPPFKGWQNYASRFPVLEQRRKDINTLISSSSIPDVVIRLDQLTASPSDPERLSPSYDSGDHLHLQKPAQGALIQTMAAGLPAQGQIPEPSPGSPAADLTTTSGKSLLPYFMLGFVALGGAFVLTRKRRH
jgi:lysophospholipase L1-like esterase